MSTNASIGIYHKDTKQSTFIYCHNDGYLEHLGVMLELYYNSPEKAQALIDLGDLSAVYANPAPLIGTESEHSFDHPMNNVTVAYHRDRDEDFHQEIFDGYKACDISNRLYTNYMYLYKDNQWYYSTGSRWNKLSKSKIVQDMISQKG